MFGEIKKIGFEDKDYPVLLKKISDPPKVLYFCGRLPFPKEKCFAVVGTRRCSAYGKEAALNMAGGLARAGLTVVSGLMWGIDSFAHLAAVEEKKRTIAVLGTGLDERSFYPKQNLGLAKRILQGGGCILSEYPAGTHGSKFTFPRRDRIISGLSLGVLVIEAKEKSGALITANFSRKQKRPVFAFPGPAQSLNSQGPHELIRTGARLAAKPEDILTELGFGQTARLFEETVKDEGNETSAILAALSQGPQCPDELLRKCGLPVATIVARLAILEIEGRVKNLGQNVYSLIKR